MLRFVCFLSVSCALAVLSLPTQAHEVKAGDLVITHPHAPPVADGARNAAVYMVITNNGALGDTLVSVSTPMAGAAEIHGQVDGGDGIMRMRPVSEVAVAPGTPVTFAPGGMHVMLIGLTAPLTDEEVFPMTLVFANAGDVIVDVYVTSDHSPASMPDTLPATGADHSGHGQH